MEIEKKKRNKIIIATTGAGGIILAIYLGISVFFINHFYPGSTINCISVAGKTIDEAHNEILGKTQNYELKISGRDGFNDLISGDDINLIYNDNKIVEQIKDSQNPLKWISSVLSNNDYKASSIISFDDDKLKACIDKLSCFNSEDIEEPKSAILQYGDKKYEILKETKGNKVNKDILYEKIINAIDDGDTSVDLDSLDCYENPKYTWDSKEVVNAKNDLDKYVGTNITYKFGDSEEVLDGDKIREFLDVDRDYNVTINEDKIKTYVNSLAEKYNTIGKTRQFVTTMGTNISISGGDYGRKIDTSEEVQYIVDTIKDGKTDVKEPKYSQIPFCNDTNDIGNTYVEISLSGQHLWFYKNGSLVIDGPVVSGNISNGTGTPGGTYKLDYKERNATLKGQGYSSPVSFWMPFNGGIGIHDASWRSSFGGNIYVSGGSHGCVNAPYSLANTIFNNIDEGTPIVCYY